MNPFAAAGKARSVYHSYKNLRFCIGSDSQSLLQLVLMVLHMRESPIQAECADYD